MAHLLLDPIARGVPSDEVGETRARVGGFERGHVGDEEVGLHLGAERAALGGVAQRRHGRLPGGLGLRVYGLKFGV